MEQKYQLRKIYTVVYDKVVELDAYQDPMYFHYWVVPFKHGKGFYYKHRCFPTRKEALENSIKQAEDQINFFRTELERYITLAMDLRKQLPL